MTRELEDLIRATQERQADRAVPAERILAALPQQAGRVRRNRRFGMLGAGLAAAAVAAAVTVPALALRDNGPAGTAIDPAATAGAKTPDGTAGAHTPDVTGGSTAPDGAADPARKPVEGAADPGANPATDVPPEIALGYRPTWVPSGFAEHLRHFDGGEPGDAMGPTLMRVWKRDVAAGDPWGGSELTLYVRTEARDAAAGIDNSGQKVDVNGVQGYYTGAQGDRKSSVNWALDDRTALILAASKIDISKSDLLRMARSVRPDAGVSSVPVRLSWLPPGWTSSGIDVSGQSVGVWRGYVYAVERGPMPSINASNKHDRESVTSQSGSLTVEVGTTTDAPDGGDTLTVAGRPARNPVRSDEAGKDLVYLVVELDKGRLMTLVGSGITRDEVKKVAEQVAITPTGLDWLGK
ncbi:DUF4367 domain-containing protein [Actinoplanes sp. NBC_00393]|uniref:hypothetical protein n=1 Tax=Actinoplanes sp. NBC_00393 TaxID=2975953 RepID=UPI002E1EECCB